MEGTLVTMLPWLQPFACLFASCHTVHCRTRKSKIRKEAGSLRASLIQQQHLTYHFLANSADSNYPHLELKKKKKRDGKWPPYCPSRKPFSRGECPAKKGREYCRSSLQDTCKMREKINQLVGRMPSQINSCVQTAKRYTSSDTTKPQIEGCKFYDFTFKYVKIKTTPSWGT